MIDFYFLKQDDFKQYAGGLFSILYENMSQIASTGNSREEDFSFWYDANKDELKNENRHIIVSIQKETNEIVGYFQYSVQNKVLLMEELVFDNMKEDIDVVEA